MRGAERVAWARAVAFASAAVAIRVATAAAVAAALALTIGGAFTATTSSAAAPSDADSLRGDWAGWAYFDDGSDLPLRLHFEVRGDTLSAALDVPSQRAFGIPFDSIVHRPPELHLERVSKSGNRVAFAAERRGEVIAGTIDWVGSAARFELSRSPVPLPEVDPERYANVAGVYRFGAGGSLLISRRFWGELVYHDLDSGRFGTLFATSDSTFFAGSASYVPGPISAWVHARSDEAGNVTNLAWRDAGETERLALRSPVREVELSFRGREGGLAGTLVLPAAAGPHAAVVIVGGSDWGSRASLRQDADAFAALGVAAFIYDKRGYGKSEGERTQPFAETAEDALAAVRFLAARSDVDGARVGLLGSSRGGWIAPIAASRSSDVGFLFLFVAPAVSPAEQETEHRLKAMRNAGHSEAEIAEARRYLDEMWELVRSGEGWDHYRAARARIEAAGWGGYLGGLDGPDSDDWTWSRLNMHHDPIPVLERVRCPVLALYGERDRLVDHAINRPRMEAALAASRNADVTVRVLPGANHAFVEVQGDRDLPLHRERRYVPEAWQTVGAWLAARAQR